MDAFAVAIASGIALKKINMRQTFRLAWHFGFFQAMMPFLGWSAGIQVSVYIKAIDHWIAFGLLAIIGLKMAIESQQESKADVIRQDPTKGMRMVMLSIATSIDAFAVGISMSMLSIVIWWPAAIIGIVALCFTAVGLHLGRWVGKSSKLSSYAELSGGMTLLAIGVHTLYDHGVFG